MGGSGIHLVRVRSSIGDLANGTLETSTPNPPRSGIAYAGDGRYGILLQALLST